MQRYVGKNVVITGGTSGVGLATARLLIDEGARVLVTGRTETSIRAVREQLGDDVVAVRSDATSMSEVEALASRVADEFEHLDVLFGNAGSTRWVPFESTTEQIYDEMLSVNAKGPYFTVQGLAPLMVPGGAVVLTTSVVNVKGVPLVSAYSAAKAALRSMTRTLARELLPRDIRVNAVSLGPIDTPILTKTMTKADAENAMLQMQRNNPMNRLGDPFEVARAVAFLAFEATYTTGAELPVDGGTSQL